MGGGKDGKWGGMGGWGDDWGGWGGKGGFGGKDGWGGKGGWDDMSWMMMKGGWGDKGGGGPAPAVFHLTVGTDNALAAAGFPTTAPAVIWAKEHEVFSSSSNIIGELCEDCVVDHDPDWERYADVAHALMAVGGPEDCIAVAKSVSTGKWAVGVASGKQGRERAGKIALAMAIAGGTELMGRLSRSYPEFASMCASGEAHAGMAYQAAAASNGHGGGNGFSGGAQPDYDANDVPVVHLVAVEPASQLPARGFPAQAYAVSHGGKQQNKFFQNAGSILSDIIGDTSDISYIDDPDWETFPEVGSAITAAGGEENCICVATYEAAGVWAVGMAAGKKPRESAAKMALAMAMVTVSGRAEELVATYPELGPLCSAAGIEGAGELLGGGEPSAKRHKLS